MTAGRRKARIPTQRCMMVDGSGTRRPRTMGEGCVYVRFGTDGPGSFGHLPAPVRSDRPCTGRRQRASSGDPPPQDPRGRVRVHRRARLRFDGRRTSPSRVASDPCECQTTLPLGHRLDLGPTTGRPDEPMVHVGCRAQEGSLLSFLHLYAIWSVGSLASVVSNPSRGETPATWRSRDRRRSRGTETPIPPFRRGSWPPVATGSVSRDGRERVSNWDRSGSETHVGRGPRVAPEPSARQHRVAIRMEVAVETIDANPPSWNRSIRVHREKASPSRRS